MARSGDSIEVRFGSMWMPATYLYRSPMGVHIVQTPDELQWQVQRAEMRAARTEEVVR